jgi:hypothetical protein
MRLREARRQGSPPRRREGGRFSSGKRPRQKEGRPAAKASPKSPFLEVSNCIDPTSNAFAPSRCADFTKPSPPLGNCTQIARAKTLKGRGSIPPVQPV